MSMNARPAFFAILSGTLLMAGSSLAFANPDQTNPRENASTVACPTSGVGCATAPRESAVTPASPVPAAAATTLAGEEGHDARRDRSRGHER